MSCHLDVCPLGRDAAGVAPCQGGGREPRGGGAWEVLGTGEGDSGGGMEETRISSPGGRRALTQICVFFFAVSKALRRSLLKNLNADRWGFASENSDTTAFVSMSIDFLGLFLLIKKVCV